MSDKLLIIKSFVCQFTRVYLWNSLFSTLFIWGICTCICGFNHILDNWYTFVAMIWLCIVGLISIALCNTLICGLSYILNINRIIFTKKKYIFYEYLFYVTTWIVILVISYSIPVLSIEVGKMGFWWMVLVLFFTFPAIIILGTLFFIKQHKMKKRKVEITNGKIHPN